MRRLAFRMHRACYPSYLPLVLCAYHYSFNIPCVLAPCPATKVLNVVAFHTKPEKASLGLRSQLLLLYSNYTCEYDSIARAALVYKVAHHSNFNVMWQLACR